VLTCQSLMLSILFLTGFVKASRLREMKGGAPKHENASSYSLITSKAMRRSWPLSSINVSR